MGTHSNAGSTLLQQQAELRRSHDSVDFGSLSENSEQLSLDGFAEGDNISSRSPVGDLSPWNKIDNVKSRPRAGAVCEPVEESSILQRNLEKHQPLHDEARLASTENTLSAKTSPQDTRRNSSGSLSRDSCEVTKANSMSTNPFDDVPPPLKQDNQSTNPFDVTPVTTGFDPSKRDRYFDDDVIENLLETNVSTSVPANSQFDSHMQGNSGVKMPEELTESHGHNRSKSMDCHPRKALNTTPPSQRKKYTPDLPTRDESHTHKHTRSLGSVKEGESLVMDGSKRSSLVSLDERSSPHSSRQDDDPSSQGYSSGDSSRRSKRNSNETPLGQALKDSWDKHTSERMRGSHDRGYSSGEASLRLANSRGYTSSEGHRQRHTTGGRVPRAHSHEDIKASKRSAALRHHRRDGSSTEEKPLTLTLYKDEDPTYIESNLNLYLDMEIFNLDKKEAFQMVFRTPVVQYGHTKEMQALVVVSNLSLYIFRVTAPEK